MDALHEPDFDGWYRTEHPRIVATLTVAAGDADIAADVAAEAFVRAYERWDRVKGMDRPGGWLHRTAMNLLRRRLRRRAHEQRLLGELLAPTMSVSEPADIDLWNAVGTLPGRMRTAVALRYVADLTEGDIAAAMGVRRGTVATLLSRARSQLAQRLATGELDPDSGEPTYVPA